MKIICRKLYLKIQVKIEFIFVLCSLLVVTSWPAFSEEKTPYCPEKEPSAPDGIIVQMQDQFYRTCGRWSGRKKTLRQFTLRVNPLQIPNLFTAYPSYNLRLAEQLEGQNALQSSIRNQPNLGTKQLGGFNYISYASDFLGPNGKPNRITYVFDGSEEIPRHWVNCTGLGFAEKSDDRVTCFVWLLENGVYADVSLLMDYEDWPQMAEHFSDFALNIKRTMDVANVTDDLDRYRGVIDIIPR